MQRKIKQGIIHTRNDDIGRVSLDISLASLYERRPSVTSCSRVSTRMDEDQRAVMICRPTALGCQPEGMKSRRLHACKSRTTAAR